VRYALLAEADRAIRAPHRADGAEAQAADAARNGAYRILDTAIGRLADLARPDATVLIVAPATRQGMASPPPSRGGAAAMRGIAPGRGILIGSGPAIARDAVLQGATVLDFCPTILACFGLSAPSDGRVLARSSPSTTLLPRPMRD